MAPRRRPIWRAYLLGLVVVLVAAVLVLDHGGHRRGATSGAPLATSTRSAARTPGAARHRSRPTAPSIPTTTTTTVPSPLPPASNGRLPQTTTMPSTSTPTFHAEMQLLWDSIVGDKPLRALRSFFPEPAYLQVKALPDDAADWTDRLEAHFELDVDAAHGQLGAGAATATLVRVDADPSFVQWIVPGSCYNNLGYWHLPGARLVYREYGQIRSIGIASLISWRGIWYVVHLGSVEPPAGTGVVDDPAVGPGVPGPPGGC